MRVLRLELAYSTNVGFSALTLFRGVCFVGRVEEQLCWYKHAGMNPVARVQVPDIINKLVRWVKSDYSWGASIMLCNWMFETRFDIPLVVKY